MLCQLWAIIFHTRPAECARVALLLSLSPSGPGLCHLFCGVSLFTFCCCCRCGYKVVMASTFCCRVVKCEEGHEEGRERCGERA